VTLGLDDSARVMVRSNVMMAGPNDRDDLYFVMFNIMAPDEGNPLRLSVATVGNFADTLVDLGISDRETVRRLITEDPERYLQTVADNYAAMVSTGEEKVSIPLDSQTNADKARAVLASLIDNKCYVQVTRYRIPGADPEIIEKAQEVPTEELIPSLKAMLDIVKDWQNFDMEAYA
jgi:hypothetical protein